MALRTRSAVPGRVTSSAHSCQGRGSYASRTRAGQVGVALGGVREAGDDRGAQGAQAGLVVAHREFVQRPLPAAAGRGVAAQQAQGVPAAVSGQVPEDGQGQAAAVLVGGEEVVGVEEVLFDAVERAFQVGVEARVIKGARLDPPVQPGVAQYALLQGGQRLRPLRREGMQGPVSASSLEEAEKGAAGRYVWVEHEVSIRCGGFHGNGISAAGARHPYRPPGGSCLAAIRIPWGRAAEAYRLRGGMSLPGRLVRGCVGGPRSPPAETLGVHPGSTVSHLS